MHKLIQELIRLYLAPDFPVDVLAQRIAGTAQGAIDLAAADGTVRAIVLPFRTMRTGAVDAHWRLLCEVAHTLQAELDLPAPAVSVSGSDGYCLWLSLSTPVAVAQAREFAVLLRQAYFPDLHMAPDAASTLVALPPCLHPDSDRWAAFIHPGMGASFAEQAGLEMVPPLSAQVSFLEGLHSIDAAQFSAALGSLRQQQAAAAPSAAPTAAPASAPASASASTPARAAPAGLLLQDATLEDIVAFLHAKNIEPTFRHLLV